jgi:predicted ATP-grasp superfamily ATP-dependent carboligase
MRSVLVVGVSTRAAAESAARAGYAVTALDAFADLDQSPGVRALSMPRDFGSAFTPLAVAKAAATVHCDAVAYLSNFENHPVAVRALARDRTLLGNPPDVLRHVRDPFLLSETLARRGLPSPRTHRDRDASANTRWLIKPRRSGGGHGIRAWQVGAPVPRGYYGQEYVNGTSGSITFAAAGGQVTEFGLTRQIVGDAAFGADGRVYCGNILIGAGDPLREHHPHLAGSARALAEAVAEEFGLVGVNGVDFVVRDGVAVAVEVNPRYSASMELVERALGFSVFEAHAATCTTGLRPALALPLVPRAVGKSIVYARHDVTCGDTEPWLDDPTIRDVPHPGEQISAGRPVCTVFAEGADTSACYEALVRRAAAVYETLESWPAAAAR